VFRGQQEKRRNTGALQNIRDIRAIRGRIISGQGGDNFFEAQVAACQLSGRQPKRLPYKVILARSAA
jgi:hypothetical protein